LDKLKDTKRVIKSREWSTTLRIRVLCFYFDCFRPVCPNVVLFSLDCPFLITLKSCIDRLFIGNGYFSGVRFTRSLVLCGYIADRCLSFCPFFLPLFFCVFPINGFWLHLWYLETLLELMQKGICAIYPHSTKDRVKRTPLNLGELWFSRNVRSSCSAYLLSTLCKNTDKYKFNYHA
jgi:hypothetical protein